MGASRRFSVFRDGGLENLGFSLKGLSKKEKELFEGGGKTMKHIEISSLKEIDEKKIVKLLRVVWM